jgi:sodium transport system permease protein
MNLKRLGVVFRKEIVDGMRDRRALYSVAFGALVGPLFVGFMFSRIAERQREARDIEIPIVGGEHAPGLVDWLGQQEGVTITEGPANAERAVRDEDEDVVVVIPEEFGKQFSEARRAEIKLVTDGSRDKARVAARRVRALLNAYSTQMAALRLIARGVSPTLANPLRVEDVEVSTAQQRAARILSFIPLYIVLAAFTGGMQIATDSTAGERERGSLEPLLVNPVSRETFVAGKWLASVLFALVTMALTAVLCAIVMERTPLQELGVRFRLGPDTALGVAAATLPMAFFASSLQVLIASFARSFKEAQSYLSMLIMFAMLPGILPVLYPITNQLWMAPIPLLGQNVLLTDVLGGKDPGVLAFALAAASALICSIVLVYLTTRLFRKERVIFGR